MSHDFSFSEDKCCVTALSGDSCWWSLNKSWTWANSNSFVSLQVDDSVFSSVPSVCERKKRWFRSKVKQCRWKGPSTRVYSRSWRRRCWSTARVASRWWTVRSSASWTNMTSGRWLVSALTSIDWISWIQTYWDGDKHARSVVIFWVVAPMDYRYEDSKKSH